MDRIKQPGGWITFAAGTISGAVVAIALSRILSIYTNDKKGRDDEDDTGDYLYPHLETSPSNSDEYKRKYAQYKRLSSIRSLGFGDQRRQRLPSLVILVRHGESEGNADETLYRTMPDNQVRLTDNGKRQAEEAGMYIEEQIFKRAHEIAAYSVGCAKEIKRVHLCVSPFERTLETASSLRKAFEHRIVRTDIQPRIREQEFGNLQGEDFKSFRAEQKKVGRFWYRFPTGESGADVYDRVKTWWYESLQTVNERVGYEEVDAMVVVTHGLTMRFVLMQLYSWSPNTFHSVWNAGNCDVYVLRKDLSKPGLAPYVLDSDLGDSPRSSIDLQVKVKSHDVHDPNRTITHSLTLSDYLSVPPPRTTRLGLIKKMIVAQHPPIVPHEKEIVSVETVSFTNMDGSLNQGRSIKHPNEPEFAVDAEVCHASDGFFRQTSDTSSLPREHSCRFPDFPWVEHSVRQSELGEATRPRKRLDVPKHHDKALRKRSTLHT